MRTCVHAQLLSPVWLFVTPWTVAFQASLSMGFSEQNAGVACHSLFQEIFWPRNKTQVSCLAGGFFTTNTTWQENALKRGYFVSTSSLFLQDRRWMLQGDCSDHMAWLEFPEGCQNNGAGGIRGPGWLHGVELFTLSEPLVYFQKAMSKRSKFPLAWVLNTTQWFPSLGSENMLVLLGHVMRSHQPPFRNLKHSWPRLRCILKKWKLLYC